MQKSTKDMWFAVTGELKTKKINEPFGNDEQIIYWVKKILVPKDDLLWYDYELFDSDMEPTQLKRGNFTCVKMCEIIEGERRNIFWFGYSIADGKGVTRYNELLNTGENGVVELIKYMPTYAKFGNWANYEAAIKSVRAGRRPSDRDADSL
ncbi:MAG: hypothetical protein NTU98_08060 [Bacteroidetes bacterium]|nr:hypothetical protein [Bacteroidota bacterium]